jgi:hypothetical protein
MCNFGPVWGWFAAFTAAIGGAVSSAIFGFAWVNAGPLRDVARIGFSATAAWLVSAALLGIGLFAALTTYCACTSALPTCASQCSKEKTAISIIFGLSPGAIIAAIALAFSLDSGEAAFVLSVSMLAISGAWLAVLVLAAMLAACQPAPPPTSSGTGGLTSSGIGDRGSTDTDDRHGPVGSSPR